MGTDMERAISILEKNNQKRVLKILNSLSEEKQEKLVKQILTIDFEKMNSLYGMASRKPVILNKEIEHINFVDKYKLSPELYEKYTEIGEKIIKNNQYAVVTMAGGQGTRLGHKGPKGTFKLEVEPEGKYLFQILAEGLIKANQKYGIILPWYIMTSTENNKETVSFFENNNYFGYDKKHIKFFVQGNLPLMLTDGELVIDEDYTVKLASDGNGCIYKSMKNEGILEDMQTRGIKWIFIGAVDNALLNMVDPVLVGLTISEGNEAASKSIAKNNPHEKVGVFCKANGVPSVIEYSELPGEMAELTDDEGELLYGEAHIMCNLFSLDALKKVADENLEYHVANKKANYMNEEGAFIEVDKPNAYKFEAFIFDAFNYFDNISILRGKREEDFAPVKNKEKVDCPETAIKLYNEYYKKQNAENLESLIV